ncbi:hypothetical protein BH09MYX1_BH09MYX1_66190 [soil metagenome]
MNNPKPSPNGTTPASTKTPEATEDDRVVDAKNVHDLWHIDLTVLPTGTGWWTPWFPFALLQRWPFCFWLGAVLDHVSRSVVAWKLWTSQPSAEGVVDLLELAKERRSRSAPHRQ